MPAPHDLGPRGRRQWRALVAADPALNTVTEPRREIAIEVCRITDLLDQLRLVLDEQAGIVEHSAFGDRIHPVVGEISKQQALHARLITALRLPDAAGKKPQRRGLRGVQQPSRPGGAKVSALDQARAAAG